MRAIRAIHFFCNQNLSVPKLIGIAIVLLLLNSCAIPTTPTGGPVDKDPPVLDTAASSPLLPVNFTKKNIELEFDEFIELDNPATSIVISPPLQKRPEYRVRGKRVIMSFHEEEQLLTGTTYTINFGDAIRDITERNVLKNFVYVFSTGPFIDSLDLKVIIKDAYTGLPVDGVIAMLHLWDSGDSALVKNKPVYFAVSDDQGEAHLQYMRADSFRLFALKDQNRNYLLDLPAEYSGFYTEPVILPPDGGKTLEILIYQRKDRLFSSSRRWRDGSRYSLIYNRPISSMEFNFPGAEIPFQQTNSGDTVIFHFGPSIIKDSLLLVATEINESTDSLFIAPPRSQEVSKLRTFTIKPNLLPGEHALIRFNHLIDTFIQDSLFFVDTIQTKKNHLRGFSIQSDSLLLDLKLDEGERGEWILLPGAVSDIFKQSNDTLRFTLSRQPSSGLSQLSILLTELDSNYQYLLQLEDQRESLVRSVIVNGLNTYQWDLPNIRPDRYTLRVIEDVNKNAMWDPGHPLQRRLPERVKVFTIIDLRANWEFDQQIDSGFFEPEDTENEDN